VLALRCFDMLHRLTTAAPNRDIIAVGAPQRSTVTIRYVGCAYVFRLQGSTWTLVRTLNPSDDVSANRMFGYSLAVYYNITEYKARVLVGAPGATAFLNGTVPNAGSGYLYLFNLTTGADVLEVRTHHLLQLESWLLIASHAITRVMLTDWQARLEDPIGAQTGDEFGHAVSLLSSSILVRVPFFMFALDACSLDGTGHGEPCIPCR
jgi:hypothetical protein